MYDNTFIIKFHVLNSNTGWSCLKTDLICKIRALYNKGKQLKIICKFHDKFLICYIGSKPIQRLRIKCALQGH